MESDMLPSRNCAGHEGYRQLLTALEADFSRPGREVEAVIADVRDDLKAFGRHYFLAYARSICGQPELLEQVSRRSYLHGNGFYKIVLEDNDLFRLRLHIWQPGARAEENIHDHRWHFASTVLAGTLETEIWEDGLPGHGEDFDEYLYLSRSADAEARNVYMGKARVALKQRIINVPGDAYCMLSSVMHRIVYDGQATIGTLMCHAKAARNWARTITQRSVEPDVDHSCISAERLKKVLASYLRSDSQNGGT